MVGGGRLAAVDGGRSYRKHHYGRSLIFARPELSGAVKEPKREVDRHRGVGVGERESHCQLPLYIIAIRHRVNCSEAKVGRACVGMGFLPPPLHSFQFLHPINRHCWALLLAQTRLSDVAQRKRPLGRTVTL